MKSEEALKQTEAGIDELVSALEQGKSESLIRFLEFQARFHHYSFRNCVLIAVQNPAATYVAGFARWKQLGRHVKKGEKGLAILAPLVRKTKKEETSDDEEEASESRTLRGFRTVFVFDVSQTEGDTLPEFSRIHGDPGDKLRRLQCYIRGKGIGLTTVPGLGGAEGVSYGGRIEILENLDPAKEFAVTAHELAHELLHRAERRKETTRKIRELEAEAVAFVVSRAAGLDAKAHSADYIQLYSGDKEMLLQSLDHIQRVATQIIAALESSEDADPKSASPEEAEKVLV
jgi:antirestriction protein ArdC